MEKITLSRIVEKLESGSREKGGSVDSGVVSIGGTHLSTNGSFKWEKMEYVSEDFYERMRSGKIDMNDILIVKDGATTGKISFVDESFPYTEAAINEHVFKVRINRTQANPKFVFYYLYSPEGQKQILSDYRGATIGGITRGFIDKVEIPLPNFEIQNKVVAILDRVNGLIEKREKTINFYNELLRATFLEMFGLSNPDFKHWDEVSISSLIKESSRSARTGPFGSALKHERFQESGEVAVLGIDNAVDNVFKRKKNRYLPLNDFEEFKNYQVFPRDVIITIMGTVGRSAVIPEDIGIAINTKHLAALTLNEQKCNPYYLAYSIHSNPYLTQQLKLRSRGAIMEGFNLTLIKELKLKKAPIGLQNQFEKIYRKNLSILEKLNTFKKGLEILFNALSQLAFRGELTFNTAVDLEVLLERGYIFFKQQSTTDTIRLLVERMNKHELNEKKFHDQNAYDKAKKIVFELLKEGKIKQVFDKRTQDLKLVAE